MKLLKSEKRMNAMRLSESSEDEWVPVNLSKQSVAKETFCTQRLQNELFRNFQRESSHSILMMCDTLRHCQPFMPQRRHCLPQRSKVVIVGARDQNTPKAISAIKSELSEISSQKNLFCYKLPPNARIFKRKSAQRPHHSTSTTRHNYN